uniref:Membrane proteins related to metalloendopeptidases n=1 Tax=uncultured Rhodospirillales bacterium HF4000_24M03 TaxID=710788 RepID=E0XW16_9PROT|nr:membrane proteins related to metalloendopeptidases [uncultured Rhodospirillales bacterium HF4000_24M03]
MLGVIAITIIAGALWAGLPSGPAKATETTAAAIAAPANSEPSPNPPVIRNLVVARGDTLMALMVKAGVPRGEAYAAITAVSKVYEPRDIKPGLRVTVTRRANEPGDPLLLWGLDIDVDVRQRVALRRDDAGGFRAVSLERALTARVVQAGGVIKSSLYLAGRRAEVPAAVLAKLIRIFSFDVDFQRDVQPDDSFEVTYERLHDEAGAAVAEGAILIAEMVLSGKRMRLYRHVTEDGETDYYDARGRSVRKALVVTPIDGARISSGFGRRRHPILGYTKMHRGTDFAAPRGTPVYGAGRGVIERAGRNGAFGHYIRIRHNGTYKTAYAHLKGYARGVKRGKRVKQGQVIGYVGSSGRSTGPHLHYEILRNGKQINPKRLNLPSGRILKGADLARFQAARGALEERAAGLPGAQRTAGAD